MMNLHDNTMVNFEQQVLILTFLNHDATPSVLEKHYIYENRFSELYLHLAKGESVWDFADKKVHLWDDPEDIVALLYDGFDALASEDNIDEIIMQGIAGKVILQNMEKLQEV